MTTETKQTLKTIANQWNQDYINNLAKYQALEREIDQKFDSEFLWYLKEVQAQSCDPKKKSFFNDFYYHQVNKETYLYGEICVLIDFYAKFPEDESDHTEQSKKDLEIYTYLTDKNVGTYRRQSLMERAKDRFACLGTMELSEFSDHPYKPGSFDSRNVKARFQIDFQFKDSKSHPTTGDSKSKLSRWTSFF